MATYQSVVITLTRGRYILPNKRVLMLWTSVTVVTLLVMVIAHSQPLLLVGCGWQGASMYPV